MSDQTTRPNVFLALADPTRRAIFERLTSRPRAVGDVAAEMPVSRSAVSQHLKVLKEAGLVHETRAGKYSIYSADPDALIEMASYANALRDRISVADADKGATIPSREATTPRSAETTRRPKGLEDNRDYIDNALEKWAEIAPAYDPATVALIARLLLVARVMETLLARTAAQRGLNAVDVIVLGTLRRMGPPHESTPTNLSRTSVISPPGTAKRLDRLERLGLIVRLPNQKDRRSSLVRLTERGREMHDEIVNQQFSSNYAVIFDLPREDRMHMARVLRHLLRHFQTARR